MNLHILRKIANQKGEIPVIFLHGFLESMSMWEFLNLDDWCSDYLLVDLPGHGKSSIDDQSSPSIQMMVDGVLSALTDQQIEKFHIVGHSMGGYVALELKKQHQGCQKVVLLNSNFWEDDAQKKIDRSRVAELVKNAKEKFVREAIPNLFLEPASYSSIVQKLIIEASQIDADAIAFSSLAMRDRMDNKRVIEGKPNDFLLIQGKEDAVIPYDKMKQELDGISAKIEILSPCGHMAHIEQSEKVLELIREFVYE